MYHLGRKSASLKLAVLPPQNEFLFGSKTRDLSTLPWLCLVLSHNFYHHQSIESERTKIGPPILCPITVVCFGFLHGPPTVFVWKSHHNLFSSFFLPELPNFQGLFCVLLFLPPLHLWCILASKSSILILIPCQSQCWAMDATTPAVYPMQLKLFLFKQNCDFIEF